MKKPQLKLRLFHMGSGNVLLSRAVSSQVPSALKGLTSVFGMGTGGTLSPLSPEFCQGLVQSAFFLASASSVHNRSFYLGELPHNLRSSSIRAYPENRTSRFPSPCEKPISYQFSLWSHLILSFFGSSPRPISIIKLHTLPHFHR